MTALSAEPAVVRQEKANALGHTRETARKLEGLQDKGRVNWCGDFTITAAANTTTVVDDRVTENCEISLHPKDANAASLLPRLVVKTLTPGTPWAAAALGRFVLEHPIVSGTYGFRYSIKG